MGKKIKRPLKWQAPANGRLFDVPFSANSLNGNYMTNRTFGTLSFVDKFSPNTSKVKKSLKKYLNTLFPNHPSNKSCVAHFIKNPMYYGLIDEIPTDTSENIYILTIDGRRMLELYKEKKWDEAMNYFILCLLRVSYKNNNAVKRTSNPSVYPFRCIFYLANKYECLSDEDLESWIPFIKNANDLDREKFSFISGEKKYNKIRIWVMSTLVVLGIFTHVNKQYKLQEKYKHLDCINRFISDKFFLFDGINQEIKNKNDEFTQEIKEGIKKANDYKCWINPKHHVAIKKDGTGILDVHHIIPWEMRDSFPNVNLNTIDNLIPICKSICHNTIHYGNDIDKKKIVRIIWNKKRPWLSKYLKSQNELFSIYNHTYN